MEELPEHLEIDLPTGAMICGCGNSPDQDGWEMIDDQYPPLHDKWGLRLHYYRCNRCGLEAEYASGRVMKRTNHPGSG